MKFQVTAKDKQAIKRFEELKKEIAQSTDIDPNERKKDQEERIERAKRDYNYFVTTYFPHYAEHECGWFHRHAAMNIAETVNVMAVLEWSRNHAKSVHADMLIPLWLKIKGEMRVMLQVGKSFDDACQLLMPLQAELEENKLFIHDYGEQHQHGDWSDGHFVTKDDCAFFCLGRGQSPRGLKHKNKRPDYISVDDIDDDELSRSQERVNRLKDWVLQALFNAVDLKHYRFVFVGNHFAKKMVLAEMAKLKGIYHLKVNAINDQGEPNWKERFTIEELENIKERITWLPFEREYQNNPIETGNIWQPNHFRWIEIPRLQDYHDLAIYIDPSWKSSEKNDYKAAKLWGSWRKEYHNIKSFVRQTTMNNLGEWLIHVMDWLPEDVVCNIYMEANFAQDRLLQDLLEYAESRGVDLPVLPDHRSKPDKRARIESVFPLWANGYTAYNQAEYGDTDMQEGIDQLLAFPDGPDDGPDADESAIYKLQRERRAHESHFKTGKREIKRSW